MLCLCRVKQIRIHNNYCDYINSFFTTPSLIKISSTSAWVGGETKACFARSKPMDVNDFLIHSNTLNIRLSRNLIAQSRGDHFCEYIKWQFLRQTKIA